MSKFKLFTLIWIFALFVEAEEILSLDQKVKKMNQAYNSKNLSRFQTWARRVLSENPKHLGALYKLGTYHLERNQIGIARILFEKAVQYHPHEEALYYAQGLIALKEKDEQKAILAFEQSLKKSRSYHPARVALSSLYMENLNVRKALPLLEDVYSDDQLSKFFAPIAHNYALALRLSGKEKKARKIYKTVIKKKKENSLILMNYALLLMESFNDYEEAQKMLDRADIRARNSRDRKRVQLLKKKLNKKR